MKPRHGVLLALGLGFLLASALAETLYAYVIRRQITDLEDEVRLAHPDWAAPDVEFGRFGHVVKAPAPSLFRDLIAWTTSRLGKPSELVDRWGIHSYYFVRFSVRRGEGWEGHQFLWSPRLRRFVAFSSYCREEDCRWRGVP